MSKYTIIDKPIETSFTRQNSPYNDILVALKNLASEKCLALTEKDLAGRKLSAFTFGLRQAAKRIGLKGAQIGIIQKDGQILVFTRG